MGIKSAGKEAGQIMGLNPRGKRRDNVVGIKSAGKEAGQIMGLNP